MISIDYKSGTSIHEQIYDGIKNLIIGEILRENDRLPSVRELSISLTVNPNTVQKAYKELENDGFIYSVKAKGNFVAEIKRGDDELSNQLFESLKKTVKEMKFIGTDKNKIVSMIDKIYENREDK